MFIKVTAANGSELWVNADHIESFGRVTKDNYDCEDDLLGLTFLCMGDEGGNYVVKETPERLMELMDEPAMMECNLAENAARICETLNADAEGKEPDLVLEVCPEFEWSLRKPCEKTGKCFEMHPCHIGRQLRGLEDVDNGKKA